MSRRSRVMIIGGGVLAVIAVVVIAIVVGLKALLHTTAVQGAPACTFGQYSLDPSQTSIAATMVGVVSERGLPERADVLVLAAALQESQLDNLGPNQGDRDSVGVLQQRPSQGWGTAAQLSDVHYATGKFLDALVKINGWQQLPLATAVQDVQVSSDGSLYAVHEPQAQALSDALSGAKPRTLSCSYPKPTQVATPAKVGQLLRGDLPVNAPVLAASRLQVPGAGWQTAAWLVANGNRLGIDSVSYDGFRWTRAKGWQQDTSAGRSAVVAGMQQLTKSS